MRLYRIEYIETPYQLTKLLPTYHKVDEDYMATFTQDDYQELLDDGYFYYRDGFEIVFDIDNDIDYTGFDELNIISIDIKKQLRDEVISSILK